MWKLAVGIVKQLMSDSVAMVTQHSMILHIPKQCLNNFFHFLSVPTYEVGEKIILSAFLFTEIPY